MKERRKKIVIVGAGFAGLTCAFSLAKKLKHEAEIKLVDKSETHTYTPWLYDVATSFLIDSSAKHLHELERIGAFSIPRLIEASNYTHLRFKKAELDLIDKSDKHLLFKDGKTMRYDYLVMAIGAQVNYFQIPGMKEKALSLKTLEDGLHIRSRMHELLVQIKKHGSKRGRIIIVGGGPTGVETASELANFLRACEKRGLDYCKRIDISILDAGTSLLGGLHPFLGRDAKNRLQELGVKVLTETLVKNVQEKSIEIVQGEKKSQMEYDSLIWAGGVASQDVIARIPLLHDDKNRIKTEKTLFVSGEKDILALGDCMSFFDDSQKKTLPPTAWVAVDVGKIAARNIAAHMRQQSLREYTPPKNWPAIITLGGTHAIGGGGGIYLRKKLAFILRRLVDLRYFLGIMPFFMALRIWTRAIFTLSHND